MKVVAFAKCNHKVICADCMLHMVMLYKIMQCPLCNGDLNQVTVTPWVEPEPPDWSHWANNLHHLWHKPEWSPQIYVSPDHYPGRDQPLHEYCWKMTARACRICDSKVERPFISDGILLTHAAVGQQRHLCIVCLQLPTYTKKELDLHLVKHPSCRLCNRWFNDTEDLQEHLDAEHEYCSICCENFLGPNALAEHLRNAHWVCTKFWCQEAMVAFGNEKELVNHYHFQHGCSVKASLRRVEQELAASVEMPVDSSSLDNGARHYNSSVVPEAGRSHDRPSIAVSAPTRAASADPHLQAVAQNAVELQLAQMKIPGLTTEAVQQLRAATPVHALSAVLPAVQASRNSLLAPPNLTQRASVASSADAHAGVIARDAKESAQASSKQALLAPASPQGMALRRPVPAGRHHQQQQLSSLHGFGRTQQSPEALPRQPIATMPPSDQRHLRPCESMPKAQPERERLYLPAGAPAAIVEFDKYGSASVHLQNSPALSRQWYPPQASNTGPAKSLTKQVSTHQDYTACAISHADVSSEALQHGPFAATTRVCHAKPGNFALENTAKPGDLHHQPFGVPGTESWNTSLSEANVHHRDLCQLHPTAASGSRTQIINSVPDTGGLNPELILPPKPQPQPRVKILRPYEYLPPKPELHRNARPISHNLELSP
ncbi:hypothetical protein WJX77_004050 [Trebouxia sp. C0004]